MKHAPLYRVIRQAIGYDGTTGILRLLIESGCARVNDIPITDSNHPVKPGDRVVFDSKEPCCPHEFKVHDKMIEAVR